MSTSDPSAPLPPTTRTQWARVRTIFRTLQAEPDSIERGKALTHLQSDEPAVAHAVTRLLVTDRPGSKNPSNVRIAQPDDPTRRPDGGVSAPLVQGAAPPPPGTLLEERYLVGEQLGAGGFGCVHTGVDTFSNTDVALKFVAVSETAEGHRYERELAALWQARVPGVVELLDDGRQGAFAYLVMERVHGEPFPGTKNGSGQTLTGNEFWQRTASFLRALRHLHASGIVHQDVKPQNVLIQSDGSCTLVDLGIAQEGGRHGNAARARRLVGTPRYIARERMYGARPAPTWDHYAAGIMLRDAVRELRAEDELGAELGPLIDDLASHEPTTRARTFECLIERLDRELGYASPPEVLASRDTLASPQNEPRLSRSELCALIDAPARIFQCPDRLASCLDELTLGCRPLVARLLQAWVAAGLGSWADERFQTTPEQVSRILALNNERLLDRRLVSAPPMAPDATRLWTALAAQQSRRIPGAALEDPVGLPNGTDELLAHLHAQRLLAITDADIVVLWVPAQEEPPSTPDELTHLLATRLASGPHHSTRAHTRDPHAHDLTALQSKAERTARDGDVTEAFRLTTHVLTQCRRSTQDVSDLYDRALATAAEWSLTASHKSAVDIARAHAELHPRKTKGSHAWALLLSAAGKVMQGAPQAACDLIDAHLESLHTVAQQRLAHIVANLAVIRTKSMAHMEHQVRLSAAWVRANPTARHRSLLAAWTGWLRFEQERYNQATALHQRAARHATRRRARYTALMNAATSAMEAGQLEQALDLASEVRRLATHAQDSVNSARAERLMRTLAYRQEQALTPDDDLIRSARSMPRGTLQTLLLVGEAAIAWRTDQIELTLELCDEVQGRDSPTGLEVLAACLGQAVVPTQDTAELDSRLAALFNVAPSGILAQATALLASNNIPATPCPQPQVVRQALQWAAAAPMQNQRRELLSPQEVLSSLVRTGTQLPTN